MACFRLLKNNLLLLLILGFGLFLYTYHLSTIPSGVYVDEAVVGYDAFSILTTSKDHFGKTLPIYFKFFNAYTPGLFVYVETLFIKIFSLNAFAIRLPSAISMLLVGIGIYIFLSQHQILKLKYSKLIAVFIFIITPWTVFNARLGYETTFAFALLSLGILLYQKPTLSFFLISLSTYAGHTQRYLAPIIILIIYFIFYYKKSFKPLIFAAMIQLPNIILLFTPAFWVKNSSLTGLFFTQYLSYFSPLNLFNNQDADPQRSIPLLALFYGWMFIPWLTGLYCLYQRRKTPVYFYLICLILLIPIPAAMTYPSFSTQRALPLLLPYSIIITIGIDKILSYLPKLIKIILMIIIVFLSLGLLWRSYFILFPAARATAWNYGYHQLSNLISLNPQKHFIVDNSRGQPSILILFWQKYSPISFQKENPFNKNYYQDVNSVMNMKFANVEVRPINWQQDLCKNQVLVGDGLAISDSQISQHYLTKLFEIKNNQNQIILQAYETNPVKKCPQTIKQK